MIKLNICIDIDGTITSPYHFIPYLNELYNKNITEEECNTHNWEVLYGVDMNTMISEFHEKYMHSYGEAKVVDDAKNIIDELKKQNNLILIKEKDYIKNPKPNGYRSYHLIIGVEVYENGEKQYYPVEIQIRTLSMDFWASIEHQLCYKASGEKKKEIFAELKEYSEILNNMGNRMERFYEDKFE